jgi:hypothetical protein
MTIGGACAGLVGAPVIPLSQNSINARQVRCCVEPKASQNESEPQQTDVNLFDLDEAMRTLGVLFRVLFEPALDPVWALAKRTLTFVPHPQRSTRKSTGAATSCEILLIDRRPTAPSKITTTDSKVLVVGFELGMS